MWKFETSMHWSGGQEGTASCPGKSDLRITPPPEFGGTPGQWTPEDQLVSAIEACLLMTTLSVLSRQKIQLAGYASRATGVMEKTADGLRFTGVDISIDLQVSDPALVEKAERAVNVAEKYCPISNAVKFPVKVQATVQVKA